MKQRTALNLSLVLALGASLIGCGDSDDGKGDTHGHGSGGSSAGGSSATGGSAGDAHHADGGSSASTGGAGGAMGGEVTLDSVAPLGNAMHVMWTNSGASCDKIEVWRNKDGGMYALAYTLAAAADSQHDAQASTAGKYCYKIRCVNGSSYTESNEKCASL